MSLNRLVNQLLARALGISRVPPDLRGDFEGFCGAWTSKEAAAFRRAVATIDRVDPEDWA